MSAAEIAPACLEGADPLGRWADQWSLARREPEQCHYCGQGGPDGDHPPTTCRACGARVCLNGGSGSCPVCLYGLLDDYSWPAACGYAGCQGRPVAGAPRVQRVCADHLDRPKITRAGQPVPLGDYVRDRAKGVREHGTPEPGSYSPLRFVWVPGPDGAT